MKRDYFDSLKFYTDINETVNNVDRLSGQPTRNRKSSLGYSNLIGKIPWDESYVMNHPRDSFSGAKDSWRLNQTPVRSSDPGTFRKRSANPKIQELVVSTKGNMRTDGFDPQDVRKRKKSKVVIRTDENLNKTIDKSEAWAPLSEDKSIGGVFGGGRSISEISRNNKSALGPDVNITLKSVQNHKNTSILKTLPVRSRPISSNEFTSENPSDLVKKGFTITSNHTKTRKFFGKLKSFWQKGESSQLAADQEPRIT
jgi:hypothetical protein